jgi:hypothetical protein
MGTISVESIKVKRIFFPRALKTANANPTKDEEKIAPAMLRTVIIVEFIKRVSKLGIMSWSPRLKFSKVISGGIQTGGDL